MTDAVDQPARAIAEPPVSELAIAFARDGNSDAFVQAGWHRAEKAFRWSDGVRSAVRLPPFAPSREFVLTCECVPMKRADVAQELTVEWNGVVIARSLPVRFVPFAIPVDGRLVNADQDNMLVFHQPNAFVPERHIANSRDRRLLALAWKSIEFGPLDARLFDAPELLPEIDVADPSVDRKLVAEAFQSLGQNCDLGMFQRKCGAEPFGLLRFASIFPHQLALGLKNRFAGVGDLAAFCVTPSRKGDELMGRHAVYGLDYHTFKMVGQADPAALAVTESRRMTYLARLFVEQLETNDKIFLRVENFESPGEALALHRLLRRYHPQARLLIVNVAPPSAPERIGRVEKLFHGLYRGYLPRYDDPERRPTRPIIEDWLKVCATVYVYDKALARDSSEAKGGDA